MSSDDAALMRIRERIDAIDTELLKLLNERAGLALDVGKVKEERRDGEEGEEPVYYRPEREAQILARLRQHNSGPLPDNHIARLFREIISCCLALEQPLAIAYLGPAGTYTEVAARAQFGQFAKIVPCTAIDEVFRQVETAQVNYGVVPVENSTEGMVNHTLDCFMSSSVDIRICAEVEVPIHHAFLVHPDNEGTVVRILSHTQSLAQCRNWLDMHYPGIEQCGVASNAEAARQVSENRDLAAVAGEVAAHRYGLRVLASSIEDRADNKTRFLVLGRQDVNASGRDKTSILVATRNRPGALYQVLEPFHRHGLSLTRIETRPARSGDWSYVFFIDFDGHQSEQTVREALADVGEIALQLRMLGSYPRSVL